MILALRRRADASQDRLNWMNLQLFGIFNWKCLSQTGRGPAPNPDLSASIA